MRGYNSITMTGTITREPEMKYSAAGLAILTLDLGGTQTVGERTLSFYQRCTVFGKFAERLVEQLTVGVAVRIHGRLNYRAWQDPQGGNRSAVDVTVTELWVIPVGEVTYDDRNQPRLSDAINLVTLAGNMARDGELRYTPQGNAVARLGMGVNERYQSGGKDQEKVGWYNVEAWNKLGEAAAELKKGAPVVVTGRLKNDSYKTKEGENRYTTVVEALTVAPVIMPGSATPTSKVREPVAAGAGGNSSRPAPAQRLEEEFPPEEDLPF
jgi:single-strand DNA-binding protein